MKFYIIDAFAGEVFGGNPAGVVILGEGQSFPADEIMVNTAAELRYSETAFMKRISEKEFHIRYFTPAAEVDLCGHATIASFSALLDAGLVESGCDYVIQTLAGRLTVSVTADSVMMDMGEAKFLKRIEGRAALEELYGVMGLEYKEVRAALLPEIISTGLPDILLPVKSWEELSAVRPDFKALAALSERYEVVGVHAFALAADGDGRAATPAAGAACGKVTAYCRNFAPLYEIDEEAATGTANGALTYYLYRNGLLSAGESAAFSQGEGMGRPSRILSENREEGGRLRIRVGGRAAILAKGEIFLG